MGGKEAELCVALALLFPVLAVVSLAQSHENNTGFSFSSFLTNNSNQLTYMGNASLNVSANGYIDLTPSPLANQYSNMYNSVGRVLYREPITVWPATFTTTFTMLVETITLPDGLNNFNGEVLAFIIVPSDKSFIPDSYGSFTTDSCSSNSNRLECQMGFE